MALGAPGWYTFPDAAACFPLGTRRRSVAGLLQFRRERYLRVPMAVFVGAGDDARDPALRKNARIDARQGANRIERGRRWVTTMRAAADEMGLPTAYEFHTLAGCGHSFEQCMATGRLGRRVFEFLFRHHRRCAAASRTHLLFHVP